MSDAFNRFPRYDMNNPIVQLPKAFEDGRGSIQNIFTDGVQSGALITSKAGTRRADHYHKTGDHLCLVIFGRILYKWRAHGSTEKPREIIVEAGQAFFTPAMVDHSMQFDVPTAFLAFDSKVARAHAAYEEDIVRLPEPLV